MCSERVEPLRICRGVWVAKSLKQPFSYGLNKLIIDILQMNYVMTSIVVYLCANSQIHANLLQTTTFPLKIDWRPKTTVTKVILLKNAGYPTRFC